VKDGSGALYCFGPKAETIKAGTHSLTRSGEEGRRAWLQGHAQNRPERLGLGHRDRPKFSALRPLGDRG